MVTRDNFGLLPAQVAGVALLTDYVLTVSVSVAAGTAALASAFSVFTPWILPISIAFVSSSPTATSAACASRGRSSRSPPTSSSSTWRSCIGVGVFKALPRRARPWPTTTHAHGLLPFGKKGNGLLVGASLAIVLHSFASGGAAVTGVEAISNGVPAFKQAGVEERARRRSSSWARCSA